MTESVIKKAFLGKLNDPDPEVRLSAVKKAKSEKEERPKKEIRQPEPRSASTIKTDNMLAEMIWDGGKAKFIFCNGQGKIEESDSIGSVVPFSGDMVVKGVVLFPSAAEEYGSEEKLLVDIREFIHRYVDVSEFFERLSSYYVLFTWLFDDFNTLPYMRVLGDYGSGKTRYLQTVGHICYKPMFAGGATTPSPVFRIIEMFHGTLVLDEADFRESEEWSEIIKILNCGFQAGFPVLRTEESDGKREPKAYDCYSPKILATRQEFRDKALESRCLTEKIMETNRDDIPLILGPDFFEGARNLRNRLLMFRFRHYGKHKIDLTLQDRTIEKRLNQVIIPLYSIIGEAKIKEEVGVFLREYNQQLIADRGEQFEAELLRTMFEILNERLDDGTINEKLYLNDIVHRMNDGCGEKDKVTAHKISWLLRKKLFIGNNKDRIGRSVNWDVPGFFKLIKRFGVCDVATFVTFTTRTSSNRHTHKETTIVTFGGSPP